MTTLQNKIDFAIILNVRNANPNGDPLNGNRPRTNYDGRGEITDVCLKRKLRDRLLESGEAIFVQSDDRRTDEYRSLAERAKGVIKDIGGPQTVTLACKHWFDVRAFGQLFAIKSAKPAKKKGQEAEEGVSDTGISVGIRGPVTIQSAFSKEPVEITSTQITKSVSGEGDGSKRSSDTMGMKHRVDSGVYVAYGSMNPQLAERTGFTDADAEKIKAILPKLFENDASSARPEGSMEVLKVVWWKHPTKYGVCSSAKVHRSVDVSASGDIVVNEIASLPAEIIDGF
jgi:CRISPR-associated protein Csd2